jgi:hypothetical protein
MYKELTRRIELSHSIDISREYDSKSTVVSYQLGRDGLVVRGYLQI